MKKVLLLSLIAGCATTPEIQDDFSGLGSLDEKSDAFSSRIKIVGNLAGGDSIDLHYTKQPRYRAVSFTGSEADAVTATVYCEDGGAKAWVVTDHFRVLGSAEAKEVTPDSNEADVSVTLPRSGKYYIVMRELTLTDADFSVWVTGAHACVDNVECPSGTRWDASTCACQ